MLIMARAAVLAASTAAWLAINSLAIPFDLRHAPGSSHKGLACDRASFAAVLPSDATLEAVAVVGQNGTYGEGSANIAYPVNPTNLPALCAVTVRVQSSSTSSYRFGLFLPDKWNSRFLVVGNGGFAGGINWLDMAAGPYYGMAALSTDTGHTSSATDASWALNQPEKKTDWGWRAIHGSTVLGKALVCAYYGRPLAYSYYSGCSTGGRQGLKELQVDPDSFDGALIGAPAWWTSHLNTYVTRAGLYNLPVTDPKHLSFADMALLAEEVTRQCDGADGVLDGIVSSPELCNPELDRLLCQNTTTATTTTPPSSSSSPGSSPSTNGCLTPPQLATARNVYSAYLSSHHGHALLYPGLTPGSEAQWYALLNGTEPSPYGVGYARDFLLDDASWDWARFDENLVALADRVDPGHATAGDYAALGRVRDRGGKVLMYHGLADGLVPTKGTEVYFNRTVAALGGGEGDGGDVGNFLRMFLVPGMQHCFYTVVDAPWNFGGGFQSGVLGAGVRSVPGFGDAQHDALLALVDWVEDGRAVDSIIATTWRSPLDPSSGVLRQRPLCPWPQKAVWDGVGDIDDAVSWSCSS